MKYLSAVIMFIFSITLLSCSNSETTENQGRIVLNKSDTIQRNLMDTSEKTTNKQVAANKSSEKAIDSTKLIKAFSDIYFGIPETIADKPDGGRYDILAGNVYPLGGFEFFIGPTTKYTDEDGLYEFDLISKFRFDNYNYMMEAIDNVSKVTLIAYGNYSQITLRLRLIHLIKS